jgi:hypothetical protein
MRFVLYNIVFRLLSKIYLLLNIIIWKYSCLTASFHFYKSILIKAFSKYFMIMHAGWENSRTHVPRRYANITVWCFFVFSHVPRRPGTRNSCCLRTYLLLVPHTWPFQVQGIQYRNFVGIPCVWSWDVWHETLLDRMALRNVGVDCLYIAIALLFLPRTSLNVLFRSQTVLYEPYFND